MCLHSTAKSSDRFLTLLTPDSFPDGATEKHFLNAMMEEDLCNQAKCLTCYVCDKSFSKTSNLYKHIRDVHKENVHFPSRKILCPSCSVTSAQFHTYEQLNQHLQTEHQIKIQVENYTFRCLKEFDEWKSQVEQATTSQYVKACGVRRSDDFEKLHFNCNRSGFFQTEGQRRRKLKSKGSCKINANCPSRIKLIKNSKTNEVKVEFIATHVGHDQDLDHLVLTKADREWVATKLSQGFEIEKILDLAHSSESETRSRLHLLTRKDILNIKSSCGSDKSINNTNDNNLNPVHLNDHLVQQTAVGELFNESCGDLYVCIDENDNSRQIQVIKLMSKNELGIPLESLTNDVLKQLTVIGESVRSIDNCKVLHTVNSLLQSVSQYIQFQMDK